ncbi:thioesterase II family protein [Streptomyces sp. H34-S4]|uniref:thioesterase II family protein n=1 Tax=Streptomyces sp. H34-S4 TaxID=2996463 RepID=UPI00226E272F|nr:alpha/beta fold hydrolase [Streptomyces sp. H34-S4]MCY0935108.1 alpha/beta fold hydrolase [Streptomyces sp. H34-S4]
MSATTAAGAWVRRFHPARDAAVRLVCFPHSGGSASYFSPLSRALSPAVDVAMVQYPGRADRRAEPFITDVREMADQLVGELLPWCDRPVALFGHSLGATVAFEVALRLESAGIRPVTLFASSRRAPSAHRENEYTHLADDEWVLSTVKDQSASANELVVDDALLRLNLPVLRADYQAAETYRYRPGPLLSCPVTALNGDADSRVTRQEAAAWGAHTSAATTFHWFPGGHFYLNTHVAEVVSLLRGQLVPGV